MEVDFSHSYLNRQIIAYIGNKRKLLPLIVRAINRCYPHGLQEKTFLDLFAGSGVVSRLAKYLGLKVYANDWEHFSFVLNSTFLGVDQRDLDTMFGEWGGVKGILDHLNSLKPPKEKERYIARYYSPATFATENVDYQKERMFYTRENGLIIDKIRNEIQRLYPENGDSLFRERIREKQLLLALLLYQAATHTNTSGVFKAYHKGFGGHNRDALNRILKPIRMEPPVLIDAPHRAQVFREDANLLMQRANPFTRPLDIVYLDPPYNQHQYGSNYHLLKTIALWDKLPVSNALNQHGVLKEKAAIRKDWVETKSNYCYRNSASRTFRSLIENIDAHHILISYSTEGIIPFEELQEICAAKGEVDILTNEYVKYPGGKQSIQRLNNNIEFVFIINTKSVSRSSSLKKMDEILKRKNVNLLLHRKYKKSELVKQFQLDQENSQLLFPVNGGVLRISTNDFYELFLTDDVKSLSMEYLEQLAEKLKACYCKNREEELEELYSRVERGEELPPVLIRQLPHLLKKLAFNKYKEKYHYWLRKLKGLNHARPAVFKILAPQLDSVEQIAKKRISVDAAP